MALSLNSVPGSELKIPTAKVTMKKDAKLKYHFKHYIICAKCKFLTEDGFCPQCEFKTKKGKNNYFVYIPLKQQIEYFFRKYAKLIAEFLTFNNSEEVSDFYNCDVYKKTKEKINENILPFTLNIDGGKIFNSSKGSLWPMQLTQLYLPPQIRYLPENVIVIGLYCALDKPNLGAIIKPFAEEMSNLSNGINVYYDKNVLQCLPLIMFCACDLQALSPLQNIISIAGYNGCPVCEHPGESIKNGNTNKKYVRYLAQSEPAPIRTHSDCIEICHQIYSGIMPENTKGLKGISPMVGFKHFDLVNGFTTDWMHGSLLGVMKQLMDIWMGKRKLYYSDDEKKKYIFKPLSIKHCKLLNDRLMALKPYNRLNYKPRSIIDHRAFFSANEYRNMLFYYLKFALKNILPQELIQHFELFSAATYTLSKSRITREEIRNAGEMLNSFANNFEKYYGANAVTMNVHLLRHYSDTVLNSGPLWVNSLFAFESNMGKLKRLKKSCVDVVETIAFNYCLADRKIDNFVTETKPQFEILHARARSLSIQFYNALIDAAIEPNEERNFVIGSEMKKNRIIYKCKGSNTIINISHKSKTQYDRLATSINIWGNLI